MNNWLGAGSQQLEETTQIPEWIKDMEFCHIRTIDQTAWLCGPPTTGDKGPTCIDYDGEAICPTCGNPTCPRCAQLEALEVELGNT